MKSVKLWDLVKSSTQRVSSRSIDYNFPTHLKGVFLSLSSDMLLRYPSGPGSIIYHFQIDDLRNWRAPSCGKMATLLCGQKMSSTFHGQWAHLQLTRWTRTSIWWSTKLMWRKKRGIQTLHFSGRLVIQSENFGLSCQTLQTIRWLDLQNRICWSRKYGRHKE